MNYKPDFILIDSAVERLPSTLAILQRFKGVDTTVIEDVRAIKRPADFLAAKKTLLLTEHKGEAFKPCQGIGAGHICCNYWIIDLISNCPMDCSYCILQHYLENNPFLTIYTNIDEILLQTSLPLAKRGDKNLRVGTGELSDSLALDHITGFSKKLISHFSNYPNVTLELKTKTTNIDHLLKVPHNGKTVIAWSVNPERIIRENEIGAATLAERFSAADRTLAAGYRIGFHFDPVICYEGWENEYKVIADEIVARFTHEKIAWISIGTLRFPRQMKETLMKRFPKSSIFYNELVPVNGKVRYFRPIREDMYKKMLGFLEPLSKTVPIYLCMETPQVWKHVLPSICASNAEIERYVCD